MLFEYLFEYWGKWFEMVTPRLVRFRGQYTMGGRHVWRVCARLADLGPTL